MGGEGEAPYYLALTRLREHSGEGRGRVLVLDEEVGGLEGGAAALSCGGRNGRERKRARAGQPTGTDRQPTGLGLLGQDFFSLGLCR
jgi:hypothetical protein